LSTGPEWIAPALPARDRLTLLAALGLITALAWAYLWLSPMPMPATSGGLRTAHYLALTFLMWLVMMIGMMTPTVMPTVLLFDRIARRGGHERSFTRTAAFAAGYLFVWLGFSAAATVLQVELIAMGWVDDMGVARRNVWTSLLLAAIGLYQWLPAKRACLGHCRAPVQFLVSAYRPGAGGALNMGVRHGLYCLGCCWALMLLLFVGGVMNLLWVAAVAALVLVEKLLARGEWFRRIVGAVTLLAALAVLVE
jgi:predicted metal-binding membrane protein